MGKKKDTKNKINDEIQQIITRLKTCDKTKNIDYEAEESMMKTLWILQ